VSGAIGEFDASIGSVKNDGEMKFADEVAEALLAGTQDIFSFLALSDVADHDERAALAADINEGGIHLANAEAAVFGAKAKFEIANLAGGRECGEHFITLGEINPKIHFAWSFIEDFLAGVAGETGVAIVEFEVRTVGEGINAEGVRTVAESGGEDLLRGAERFFGVEQVIGDPSLLAIGEDEANGRADHRGSDGEPCKEKLFTGDGAAHEDNEKRDSDGENLSNEEIADTSRRRRSNGIGRGLFPAHSEKDDDGVRKHPEEIPPTGGDASVNKRVEVLRVGKDESEEDKSENKGERAQPGRQLGARAEKESGSEDEVASQIEDENLAEERGLIGLPARRRVEEIEVKSGGEDGDLEEVEKAKGVDGAGVLVGTRKEDHENRSGPDEEEDVGRPGTFRGARNETLVVSADALANGFESKSDGEEIPDLARVAGRATGNVEADERSGHNHGEIEGVREKQVGEGGANEFEVEEK
jgi:hypothetical protein